jgi:phage terminase large subunit
MATEIVIPYAPRVLQRELHIKADAHRFGAIVCHRRFGKTVFAVNHLGKGALTCSKPRPRFAHIFPTYTQAKAVGWDYAKHYAGPIPGHQAHETELRIDYPNGGQYRMFGADNPDSLRGLYFDGVIFDEYGLQPPNIFSEVIRPALSDRGGWALFLGTPNGKNQFYDAKQTALQDESGDWFFAEYKASQTGILSPKELADARSVMTADEYAQEYECSFEASVKGAIFARELLAAREDGRVTRVPYDPALPVDTDWDLGVGDSTAIWFSQSLYTGEVRLIDYYEASGEGLPHYANVLNRKGYSYGTHTGPHDIEVRELTTGRTRLEAAKEFGIHFRVAPRTSLEDGINAARMLLPKCWFDADKCKYGLETLQHYHWDYNTRINEFKPVPVHDWASHGADAFRGLANRHWTPRKPKRDPSAPQRDFDPADRPRGAQFARLRRGGY